jgi:hypothetical protein
MGRGWGRGGGNCRLSIVDVDGKLENEIGDWKMEIGNFQKT